MRYSKPTDKNSWRHKLHEIIFEADTPMGKLFDVILLILILLSVIVVMLESVKSIDLQYHRLFYVFEWIITIFFTLEYIARIITVKKPKHYIFSFYGIIDFIATIPLYLSFIFIGSNYLLTVRALRLLRVFRILKITRYVGEGNKLRKSLIASRVKIFIFIFAILIVAVIAGTLMYLIEGEESGFKSIPVSVYWCIVTLTTVGFGDIAPVTAAGRFLATFIMILGYGVIAVPTAIISTQYMSRDREEGSVQLNTQSCRNCGASGHKDGAEFCYSCGEELFPPKNVKHNDA